ncbi:MAG: hypothetical protein A3F11_06655 [Gammaproteobacteria bacterium RIFCSPHIGHO2_12_FULL_37_14]|nr:MAG: hypothetical protein A3F11_06655 [Gammaproteobacteria bacterium RIFCSPHIGHO2_12_FULL_37_14]
MLSLFSPQSNSGYWNQLVKVFYRISGSIGFQKTQYIVFLCIILIKIKDLVKDSKKIKKIKITV